MTVRDFNTDKAMSDQPAVVEAIKAACQVQWPDLLGIERAHQLNDLIGVDYWLEFQGGVKRTLDVKVRKDDYSLPSHGTRQDSRTACLELVSNTTTNKAGWSLDPAKITDYVLFYYKESGAAIFYDARQLRAAVIHYLPELKQRGKPSVQSTGRYQSTSLFVSHRELGAAIYRHSQHVSVPLAMAA